MPTFTSRNTIIGLGGSGGDSGSGNYIPMSQKSQPNGVATLDGQGKVPLSQLPPITGGGEFTVVDWDVRKVEDITVPYILESATYENDILTYIPYVPEALTVVHKTTPNIIYEDKVITYSGNVSDDPVIIIFDINDGFRLSLKPENFTDDGKLIFALTQADDPADTANNALIAASVTSSGTRIFYRNLSAEDRVIESDSTRHSLEFRPSTEDGHVFSFSDGVNNVEIDYPALYDPSKPWFLLVQLWGKVTSGNPFNINYELGLSTPESNNLFGGANYQGFPAHDFSIEVHRDNTPSFAGFALGTEVYDEGFPQQNEDSMCYVEVNTNSFYLVASGNPAITIPDFFNSEGIGVINYIHETNTIEVNGQSIQMSYVPKSLIAITGTTVGFKLNEFTQGGLINGDLPDNAKDGQYYRIISDGMFANKLLNTGDFAVLFNDKTDVIVIKQ